jgi:hypothetical protein
MPTESTVVRTRDHLEAEVSAEITRYNLPVRLARSLPIFVGSVLLGAATIIIPAVHLISTWFIPLLGSGIALYFFRIHTKVGRITGTCPACSEAFHEQGGPYEDPMWIRCTHCTVPLELILPQ